MIRAASRPAAMRPVLQRPALLPAWLPASLPAWLLASLLAWLLAMPAAAVAQGMAREHVVLAGSSTMFPFAAAVAERQRGPGPLVLPMGSGAGLAWFCEGLGPATPDVVMTSRPMLPEEAGACHEAGVGALEVHEVGRDGIVLAAHPAGAVRALAIEDLWRALAVRVPDPAGSGRWVKNPYRAWQDIHPSLPAAPIRVFGPPATSGTRDVLVSLALWPACEAAIRANPGSEAERQRCGELRRDGRWVDAGENDDGLVARLQSEPAALALVGHGAVVRSPGQLSVVCLDGVCPSGAAIATGDYPLSRPLFLYVKTAHRALIPGLDALVNGFFTDAALADDGYLARLGLVTSAVALTAVTAVTAVTDERVHAIPASAPPAAANLRPRAVGALLVGVLLAAWLGLALVRRRAPVNRALEHTVGATLWSSAAVSGALLAVVLATLVVPTLNFFLQVSPFAFLSGTHWSPESAIRASQAVGEGAFGILPVLVGSVLVAAISLLVALPLSLLAALHGYAWARPRHQRGWRLGLRLAALVPAVIYGMFAALTVGPAVAVAARAAGAGATTESTLAAGLVIGIMLLPALTVRISEALAAVPPAAAESAMGLGATRWEALRDILLPAAAPGIGAGVLLAVTRALGETVIVLMVLGLVARWTLDPLGSTSTLTVQMVTLMSGTHEMDNVRTLLPFVLGLSLAILVLPLNAWALRLLRRSNVSPSPLY